MTEIERKFLVKNTDFIKESVISFDIKQGYLNIDPERTVRIRTKKSNSWFNLNDEIDDSIAYITIKGKSSDDGLQRFEWENEIKYSDASKLLDICVGVLSKKRYIIPYDNHYIEVDVFNGDSEGLIVAEIEFNNIEEIEINMPSWIGKEVTGDIKYYNSGLIKNPYKNWNEEK